MRLRTRSDRRLAAQHSSAMLENLEPRLLLSASAFIQMGTLRFELLAYSSQTGIQASAALPTLPSFQDDMPVIASPASNDWAIPTRTGTPEPAGPTTSDGHSVSQITWRGQPMYVVDNQYLVEVNGISDFSGFAAKTGLDVTDVKDLGNDGFVFMVRNATPDQVAAWGEAAGDAVVYVEPNSVIWNGLQWDSASGQDSSAVLPTATSSSTSPPTSSDGHPVSQITWQGQSMYVVDNQYLVELNGVTDFADFAARTGLDVTDVKDLGNSGFVFMVRNATPDQVAAWGEAAGDAVVYVEPNSVIWNGAQSTTPNDAFYGNQWFHNNTGQFSGTVGVDIDSQDAWDVTRGSPSVYVGVIDTGADFSHLDLGNLDATNAYNGDSQSVGSAYAGDSVGHGTHVAGIIAATGNNSIGVAGVTWYSQVVMAKAVDSSNQFTTMAIRNSLYYLISLKQNGMNLPVINMSVGSPTDYSVVRAAVSAANSEGILIVCAAGNNGLGVPYGGADIGAVPTYPAAYSADYGNVIAVANTTDTDALAFSSNYSQSLVQVGAPGTNIYSTYIGGTGYAYDTGTSMASPIVAGIVALEKTKVPGASMAQLREATVYHAEYDSQLAGKVIDSHRANADYSVLAIQTDFAPRGSFDAAINTGSQMTLYGWAFDADLGSTGMSINFYDGTGFSNFVGATYATTTRTDLTPYIGGSPHGIDVNLTSVPVGHTLYAYYWDNNNFGSSVILLGSVVVS